ncbi:MAG: aminomethyl-transferring glycine dehydrogenase subunit GcvPA [Gammaproteobacteria bacterium]|nr:aminomethyl-transferring glycine dehydrogenase subunit GcvPA [Gammaproteobacteria bacterium]MCH9743461.1 aminomethyl-transferring glycine dehydrogenase subunit GcvPA [Gammaproteobacteria bacterium]
MPYIPHTQEDVAEMLDVLEIKNVQQLFDEVPKSIPKADIDAIAAGISEMEVTRVMQEHAPRIEAGSCFIGAGAYDHHIPAAIWDIVSRGEFYTAYTPYQAEASQGTLQLLYEYQTMMANLMGMDVANASLYDGASALAEAVLMAVRIKRGRAKRVLVPTTIHPAYRKVLQTVLKHQDIFLEDVPYCSKQGNLVVDALDNINPEGLAAAIIPQPNFFGVLEEVDALTQKLRRLNALTIALVNPTAMALLKEPGSWGGVGADIVCGEGQPLGVPLMSGGPYFGFMCCRQEHVRQLPGRIVGRTHDDKGQEGFVLTLQAREQHIRRSKATSNICTNQGLLVTAATIYMSLMGPEGLRDIAATSHHSAAQLKENLMSIDGVEAVFDGPMFHEFVIRLSKPVELVQQDLAEQGLQAGYNLKQDFPELGDSLLVCVTETKTALDLERYQLLMAKALG